MLHLISYSVHTHRLGVIVAGYLVDGTTKQWSRIGKISPQEPRIFRPVETEGLVAKPDDTIVVRCTMVC